MKASRGPRGSTRSSRSSVVVLLLLLVAPAIPATASSFLQESVDAAHTGSVDGTGPRVDEVAFRLQLPGSRVGQVLLLDGGAYVLTRDVEQHGLTENALWRIDLQSAAVERLATFRPPMDVPCKEQAPVVANQETGNCYHTELVSDGAHLYVARSGGVDKLTLRGVAVASWEHPPFFGADTTGTICDRGLALEGAALYVVCAAFPQGEEQGQRCCPTPLGGWGGTVFAARLSTATLEQDWLWFKDSSDAAPGTVPLSDAPARCAPAPADACVGDYALPVGLAVVGPVLVLFTLEASSADQFDVVYWGINKETGDNPWRIVSESEAREARSDGGLGVAFFGARPTGDEDALYLRVGPQVQAVNPLRAATVHWSVPIGAKDPVDASYLPTGTALADGQLFVQSYQTLYRIDAATRSVAWERTVANASNESYGWNSLLVSQDAVYGTSWSGAVDPAALQPLDATGTTSTGPTSTRILFGLDRSTGDALFAHPLEVRRMVNGIVDVRVAVGDGLLVAATEDGTVLALGRSAASLAPALDLSQAYPAPGEPVRADLSGSTAGALGPPTRYRADWGDGTVTEWTTDPVMTHAYEAGGVHEATFWAGNDAGQTAAAVRTVDVGGTPPTEPNLVQTAFERRNQPATFAVLGFLAVAVGSAWGVARHRRRNHEAAAEEDRLQAYREVMVTEIQQGTTLEELASKLRPVRAALGVSDRRHARLEATLHARSGGGGLVPGQTFLGRYEVLEHLGTGGGGSAYRCRDTRIGRDVVLKTLDALGPREREGLVREAHAFGSIDHPNVVRVHDVEQLGDAVHLVLEHVDGTDLSKRLAHGALPTAEVVSLAHDLLAGLGAVHAAGLLHRDVKPANVLVGPGGVHRLADFGIATTETRGGRGAGSGATRHAGDAPASAVGGTASYMSPEQARGARMDRRSDLYSAAVVLWEALSGDRYVQPRRGETATSLRMRIANGDGFPRPRPGASAALDAWTAKALAVHPRGRYPDAEAMQAAFDEAIQQDA